VRKDLGISKSATWTREFQLIFLCTVAGPAVWGQKRPDEHEFNDPFQSVNSSQVKRSAYVKVTWQF